MATIKDDAKILEILTSLSKQRGFVFQSSEIYGGLGSTWDYGPLGVELKRNVKNLWWDNMITSRSNVVGMDASILMHPKVWEASGHVENFHDPLVDNKISKKRYRLDHLLEEQSEEVITNLLKKLNLKKSSDSESTIQSIVSQLLNDEASSGTFIIDSGVIDPHTKEVGEWTNTRQFNLMFKTHIGPVSDSSSIAYLRPETAQGIFVNYLNVQSTSRQKLPFGIGQIGKAFRNEITTGNFIFRTREFEQMEMEFFCEPDKADEWFKYWINFSNEWFINIGLSEDKLRKRAHTDDEKPHYAKAALDIEYNFPWGWGELETINNRSDHDLKSHSEKSGKDLSYFDESTKERYVPYVIEPAMGADRTVLAILCDAYSEEEVDGDKRTVLRFKPQISPVQVAILPLSKNEKLAETSEKIYKSLKSEFRAQFDNTQSIGKRYRRQDEIGTPICLTIDFDTVETDNCVTLRHRDTMDQVRVKIDDIKNEISKMLKSF